jgi:hypothetical protein
MILVKINHLCLRAERHNPWIKIKLKVLIFPTIQKLYCRHFSFMAGFVDALRPTSFTGVNFKRWQIRVILWLTSMNVFWVFEGKPEGELTPEKDKEYSEANTIFCDTVVGVLVESLQDTYLRYKTAKEMWDTPTLSIEVQMLALNCTSLSSTTTTRR